MGAPSRKSNHPKAALDYPMNREPIPWYAYLTLGFLAVHHWLPMLVFFADVSLWVLAEDFVKDCLQRGTVHRGWAALNVYAAMSAFLEKLDHPWPGDLGRHIRRYRNQVAHNGIGYVRSIRLDRKRRACP